MAATVLGTSTFSATSGSSLSPSVTVQSGATAAYAMIGGWAGSGLDLTSATLNGVAADSINQYEDSGDLYSVWLLEWRNPATGSRTLALNFDESISALVGGLVSLQGGSLTGIRAFGTRDFDESSSFSLTTVADDLVLAMDVQYLADVPANQSGWTSVATVQAGADTSARIRSIIASGSSVSVSRMGTSFDRTFAFSIAPATGGGAVAHIPAYLQMLRSNQ